MTPCKYIGAFSCDVYDFLTDVFSYRLSFSEIGLTDHLMLALARYSSIDRDNTIEIYKTSWRTESVYGNDIDLFVQNNAGTFNWYALQAKVMSYNGAFKDLKFKRNSTAQQWDKLLLHESNFGSKTYYLLYSGKSRRPPTDSPTRSDCIGIPSIEELGLGIVETQAISSIRASMTNSQQFFFRHVFPNQIDSIRKLFCCSDSLPQTTKQFKRADIDTKAYRKIYSNTNYESEETDDEIENIHPPIELAPNIIIKTNRNANS